MYKPGHSANRLEIPTVTVARRGRFVLTSLLLLLMGFGSASGRAQTPATKRQEGWLYDQFRRFRSYPHLDRLYRLMTEGRSQEARAEMETYLSLNPGDRFARMDYLALLYSMNEFALVESEAGRMLQEKTEGRVFLYRAFAREKLMDTSGALADFMSAAGAPDLSAKDRTQALEQAIDIAIARKEPKIASEALGKLGESASTYRYHMRRGMVLELDNHPGQAAESFEHAASAAGTPGETAEALEFAGEAYAKIGDRRRARAAFERALAIDRDRLVSLRGLGEIAFSEKRYSESIDCSRRALAIEENDSDRSRLAHSLREAGNLAEAGAALEPLIKRSGDSAVSLPYYMLKGDIALARQNTGEAEAAFQAALR